MSNDWSKTLLPRPGGFNRLAARLDAEELERKNEIRVWAGFSAAMIGALIFVSSLAQKEIPTAGFTEKIAVENAQVVERAGTPAGIHYYWVFQE